MSMDAKRRGAKRWEIHGSKRMENWIWRKASGRKSHERESRRGRDRGHRNKLAAGKSVAAPLLCVTAAPYDYRDPSSHGGLS